MARGQGRERSGLGEQALGASRPLAFQAATPDFARPLRLGQIEFLCAQGMPDDVPEVVSTTQLRFGVPTTLAPLQHFIADEGIDNADAGRDEQRPATRLVLGDGEYERAEGIASVAKTSREARAAQMQKAMQKAYRWSHLHNALDEQALY